MFAHVISLSFSSACEIFSASVLFAVVTKTIMKLLLMLVHSLLFVCGK
jgi:hypothetical protein